MIYFYISTAVLLANLAIAVGFAFYFRHQSRAVTLRLKENPSYETQILLADVLTSTALLRIERVPPENFFIQKGT